MRAPIPERLREKYDKACALKRAEDEGQIDLSGKPVAAIIYSWAMSEKELIEQIAALEAQNKQLREALLKRGLSYAPCDICGYKGPGYYQPATHPCAALAATEPRP